MTSRKETPAREAEQEHPVLESFNASEIVEQPGELDEPQSPADETVFPYNAPG